MVAKSKSLNRPHTNVIADQDTKDLVSLFNKKNHSGLEAAARRVLSRKSHHAYAARALAVSIFSQGRFSEALPLLLELGQRFPSDWEVWANLGAAQYELGNISEAIKAYETCLSLNSRADVSSELIRLYRLSKSDLKALQASYAALEEEPESRERFLDWISSLLSLRKFEEAFECLKGAWLDEPTDPDICAAIIPPARSLCEWEMAEEAERVFCERFDQGKCDSLPPLQMIAVAGFGRVKQRQYLHGLLSDIVPQKRHSEQQRSFSKDETAVRKLRIGYLSADFRNHATSYLITGVFEQHRNVGLELYAYSLGIDDGGEYRQRIKQAAQKFHDVRLMNSEQIADLIIKDQIDILVDLKGWTEDFRGEIQASHPAPVTVSWLGYPGTLGSQSLADYIIGDPIVTPLSHADGYTEQLALMPYCYQPNDANRFVADRPSRASVGLPDEAFVFCSFNRSDKITQDIFEAWCEILEQTPGSVLWLYGDLPRAKDNLLKAAHRRGLRERLYFASPASLPEHLARLQVADLALDTFPYTSHTTASDALWAGLPLVALEGDSFVSRVSSSLVSTAGLPELIARSLDEYKQKAVTLASSPELLLTLRQRLSQMRDVCPLFDTERFAWDLARLYRAMWLDFCDGIKRPIVLEPT